jgi:hypothetical protein
MFSTKLFEENSFNTHNKALKPGLTSQNARAPNLHNKPSTYNRSTFWLANMNCDCKWKNKESCYNLSSLILKNIKNKFIADCTAVQDVRHLFFIFDTV